MMPRSTTKRKQVHDFSLRLPVDLYAKLLERKAETRRPINSEILLMIERDFAQDEKAAA